MILSSLLMMNLNIFATSSGSYECNVTKYNNTNKQTGKKHHQIMTVKEADQFSILIQIHCTIHDCRLVNTFLDIIGVAEINY